MRVPTAEELAAIAVAYAALQQERKPPTPAPSRWRLAARALEPDEPRRNRWRSPSEIR